MGLGKWGSMNKQCAESCEEKTQASTLVFVQCTETTQQNRRCRRMVKFDLCDEQTSLEQMMKARCPAHRENFDLL